MRRLDFEQAILEMFFEVGYEFVTPATVAYFLKIPIKLAEQYLDQLIQDDVLELEVNEHGHILYALPLIARPKGKILEKTHRFRSTHGEGGVELQPSTALGYHSAAGSSGAYQDSDWGWRAATETDQAYPLVPIHDLYHLPTHTRDDITHPEQRSPTGSMLLSFLWPGLGQVYNGQPGKGVVLFFSSAFLWMIFLGWMVHLYALIDAGVTAHRINQRWERRRALPA